jgi:DNA repair protein RecO (recombination protein O)
VSGAAGAPWHDRLLRLPAFLQGEAPVGEPSAEELAAGFALTGYFLTRHVLEPRAAHLPEARSSFIAAVTRPHPAASGGG